MTWFHRLLSWLTRGRHQQCCDCGCWFYHAYKFGQCDECYEEHCSNWLCDCGHVQDDGLHCDLCGREPPWGCPCELCEAAEADEDCWGDVYGMTDDET